MNVNNNITNLNLKVKCGLCEKSFFGEFLSKHMRVSHPGVERPSKKISWEIKLQPIENDDVKCLDCNKIFSAIDSAKIHYKTEHLTDKNSLKFFCKFVKRVLYSRAGVFYYVNYVNVNYSVKNSTVDCKYLLYFL